VAAATIFWVYALAVSLLIPVTACYTPMMMVIPVILAVPHLPRRRFRTFMVATVAAATAAALAGSLLPGAGIQEHAPEWFVDLAVIDLVVINTTLALFFAWENHMGLSAQAQALRESQRRLVEATERERRRIERNLHDGAQQRLVAAAMELRVAQRLLATQPERVGGALAGLAGQLREAGAELRDLTYDIFPPQLTAGGLAAALRAAVDRSPRPATVCAIAMRRYPPEIELSVYFCCLEALQNAVKHAGEAASATITLADHDGLTFDIRDTGPGCDPATLRGGHGIANVQDRLNAIGGTLTVITRPGAGVHVRGHIPQLDEDSASAKNSRALV
jgi:signal transduction histidine kinase